MSLILGIFILGILAGWILEWLVVFLFMPNPKKRLQTALDASRKEVATLQTRIRNLEAQVATAATASPTADTPSAAMAETNEPNEPEAEASVSPEVEETVEAASQVEPEAESTAQPDIEVAATPTPAGEPAKPDDLTKLGGVGPKLAEAMQAAGITHFTQIAEMGGEAVGKRLSDNGVRYAKAAAETWAEQAKLAAQGDWKGLKDYQDSLKA